MHQQQLRSINILSVAHCTKTRGKIQGNGNKVAGEKAKEKTIEDEE
jgi:hypothetical protein